MNNKKCVAIIPARGGSKGLPNKNITLLAGMPLISYSIVAAKQCELIDRVIVTTDSEEIARIAREYGAEAPFLRPPELSRDDTATEPVLKHAVEWLESNEQYYSDIVVFLQPTDIFRKKYMLTETVSRLLKDDNLDSAFVAYPTHKNFWRKVNGQFVRLASDMTYGPRQKREHLYREDTGLACATRTTFIKKGLRIGPRVDIVENPSETSSVDIHDAFDMWLAERIIREGGVTVND
jgi:CMP-N,N'-diacetyllegionaminic acid synthase